MADLNINKSGTTAEITRAHEDSGQNLIPNGDFESSPSFTAATTTNQRWIDGTSGGSTTDDTHYWAMVAKSGSAQVQFDSSVSHSGSNSLKLSTTATASAITIRLIGTTTTVANVNHYGIPVYPSTAYSMTGWLQTTLNSGAATSGASLQLLEYNDTSTTALATRGTLKVTTTTSWTQYTVSFTTTSTTVYVTPTLIITGNDGTGTLIMDAWFDDLVLQSSARNGGLAVPLNPIVTSNIQTISGPKIWS